MASERYRKPPDSIVIGVVKAGIPYAQDAVEHAAVGATRRLYDSCTSIGVSDVREILSRKAD
jgi:hypothetical protein